MSKSIDDKLIFVLGAGGFIGTNLCRRLISDGKKLVVFDREGTGLDALSLYADSIQAPTPIVIYGDFDDFRDTNLGDKYLTDVGIVYHLISTTCPTNSNKNIASEMDSNVITTINLLDACVRNNVDRVIFLSSGGTVYGKDHTGVLREDDEAYPISSYGIQKLTIEKMLYLYGEMYNLDYRVVRLANPYGPYQKPNGIQGVVSTFTWKSLNDESITVYGDGSVIRDYIYIDDAVDGIIKISSDQAKYKLYNLGSGMGTSVSQVIECISKALNKELDIQYTPGRQVDVPKNVLDVSRFISDFGNPYRIQLEEGIRKLADFYLDLIDEKN